MSRGERFVGTRHGGDLTFTLIANLLYSRTVRTTATSKFSGMAPPTLVHEGHFTTTIFHLFPRLPAEIRAMIWRLAHQHEQKWGSCRPYGISGRIIEFYDYNSHTGSVDISVSQPWPTFFSVNREARYEAARCMKGEWVTIKGPNKGPDLERRRLGYLSRWSIRASDVGHWQTVC